MRDPYAATVPCLPTSTGSQCGCWTSKSWRAAEREPWEVRRRPGSAGRARCRIVAPPHNSWLYGCPSSRLVMRNAWHIRLEPRIVFWPGRAHALWKSFTCLIEMTDVSHCSGEFVGSTPVLLRKTRSECAATCCISPLGRAAPGSPLPGTSTSDWPPTQTPRGGMGPG